jgi:hypothetical protein
MELRTGFKDIDILSAAPPTDIYALANIPTINTDECRSNQPSLSMPTDGETKWCKCMPLRIKQIAPLSTARLYRLNNSCWAAIIALLRTISVRILWKASLPQSSINTITMTTTLDGDGMTTLFN